MDLAFTTIAAALVGAIVPALLSVLLSRRERMWEIQRQHAVLRRTRDEHVRLQTELTRLRAKRPTDEDAEGALVELELWLESGDPDPPPSLVASGSVGVASRDKALEQLVDVWVDRDIERIRTARALTPRRVLHGADSS